MRLKERSHEGQASTDDELFIVDAVDDLRWVLMRAARLAIVVTSEVVSVTSLVAAFGSGLRWAFTFNEPATYYVPAAADGLATRAVYSFIYAHPALAFWTFLALMAFSFSLIYATGFEHRYSVKKPGLDLRRCARCEKTIPDRLICPACGLFRLARVGTALCWLLSAAVTGLWAVHDVFLFLLACALTGGKK